MTFEHEQFQRFLQNDVNNNFNADDEQQQHYQHRHYGNNNQKTSSIPSSSVTAACSTASTTLTPSSPVQHRKVVTIISSSSSNNNCGTTTTMAEKCDHRAKTMRRFNQQRRTTWLLLRRKHYDDDDAADEWSRSSSMRKLFLPSSSGGRLTLLVTGIQLALLCAWLLHELASGFDESQCFLPAAISVISSSVSNDGPSRRHAYTSKQLQNGNQIIEQTNMAFVAKTNAAAAAGTTPNENNATMQHQQHDYDANANNGFDIKEGSALPKTSVSSVYDVPQRQTVTVPKRRRKVILRRRLLRKGATPGGGSSSTTSLEGSSQQKGAIRRVVWRVVPLKKLPPNEPKSNNHPGFNVGIPESDMAADANAMLQQPVRTKTGIVMRIRGGGNHDADLNGTKKQKHQQQSRRVVRRKTLIAVERRRIAGDDAPIELTAADAERTHKTHQNVPEQQLYEDETRPVPTNGNADGIYAPEQLNRLVSVVFCYARTIFDFWCLVQCFCSALFLLALHLRHRLLAMVPIVVNVVSIVLALIFGISMLMFPLILLLWLPATTELSIPPLLFCFGFAVSIHVCVALFAWSTFVQLRAVNRTNLDEQQQQQQREKDCGGKMTKFINIV